MNQVFEEYQEELLKVR